MTTTANQLAFQLRAAANYIDTLGGVSTGYRQALAAHEAQAALAAEPVTDKQLLAEAEFAESYDTSAPSFMSLLRDDAVVGDFQRRLLICMRAAAKLAAPVAQAEPAWLPIETAPKDGSTIMLLEDGNDEPFFGFWWEGRARWRASTIHYDTDGDACVIDRIYSEGVSHWMPLPQPPKEQP